MSALFFSNADASALAPAPLILLSAHRKERNKTKWGVSHGMPYRIPQFQPGITITCFGETDGGYHTFTSSFFLIRNFHFFRFFSRNLTFWPFSQLFALFFRVLSQCESGGKPERSYIREILFWARRTQVLPQKGDHV